MASDTQAMTPEVRNAMGVMPAWCNKPVSELQPSDVVEIAQYCALQGWFVGMADAKQGKAAGNPFSEQLLNGVPRALWELHVCRGQRAAKMAPGALGS